MMILGLLLITYTTIAYGIHGGELYTGINRQLRNLACAIPFILTMWLITSQISSWEFRSLLLLLSLSSAYGGVSLGFDWFPATGWKFYAGLAIKGFINLPIGGFISLPLSYAIGNRTKWKNVFSEYFSGTLYGGILCGIVYSASYWQHLLMAVEHSHFISSISTTL